MVMKQHDWGFTLKSDSVEFDFISEIIPLQSGNVYQISGIGKIPVPDTKIGDRLLLPINDGMAISVEREYEKGELATDIYGGTFCGREGTLGMVILERHGKYLLIKVEDTAYSSYLAKRDPDIYKLSIFAEKYTIVTYAIFDTLVKACQFYRNTKGKEFVSLTEKINQNENIKELVGGGIFWIWNDNYDKVMYSDCDTDICPNTGEGLEIIAADLHKNGVERAMFGMFFDGDSEYVEKLYKDYGYIATQYDNYNDVLNAELLNIIPNNRVKNCSYTFRRMKDYPEGVAVTKEGKLAEAWALRGFDGKMHPQNTLCPVVAAERMKKEIAEVLKQYPYYKGRFIDVYGTYLNECYNPEHPLSLNECKDVKNNAFRSLKDMGLIIGTEECMEDILDNLDYSEGLHSPVYFRILDAGRAHAHVCSQEQTEFIKKYMMNPECRVPLWELVYHECMIIFPYWGDSTEMNPDLYREKILFACLYGCAPLYSFMLKDYLKLKPIILSSYHKITNIHKQTAELPMTDFEIISDDYKLQRSVFGNQFEVIVNFSEQERDYRENKIPAKDVYFGKIKKGE